MRIARIIAVLGVSLLLADAAALAQVNNVQPSSTPIVAGNAVTYTASCTPTPAYYDWDYIFFGWSQWVPNPPDRTGSNNICYPENRVGTWNVRCTAWYSPPPDWRYYRGAVEITVQGVNQDLITGGTDTNSGGWPMMHLFVKFKPQYAAGGVTIDMGPAPVTGYPQYRDRSPGGEWSAWMDNSDYCWLVDNEIWMDFGIAGGAVFLGKKIGEVFYECDHQNQMVIYDGDQVEHKYPLTVRHLHFVKTADYAFQVHVVE